MGLLQWITSSDTVWAVMAVLALVGASAALFVLLALAIGWQEWRWRLHAVSGEGRVVDNVREEGSESVWYYPVVERQEADGRPSRHQSQTYRGSPLRLGATVALHWLPDSPDEVRVGMKMQWSALALCLIVAAILVMGLLNLTHYIGWKPVLAGSIWIGFFAGFIGWGLLIDMLWPSGEGARRGRRSRP